MYIYICIHIYIYINTCSVHVWRYVFKVYLERYRGMSWLRRVIVWLVESKHAGIGGLSLKIGDLKKYSKKVVWDSPILVKSPWHIQKEQSGLFHEKFLCFMGFQVVIPFQSKDHVDPIQPTCQRHIFVTKTLCFK